MTTIIDPAGNPPLAYSLRLYDAGGNTVNSSFRRLQLRYVSGEWRYRENG